VQRGDSSPADGKTFILGGGLAGLILFAGASLQQTGIVYTTAGKAGFITGIYVILVPILGIFLGQRTALGTWIGASGALVGLYLLSVTETLTISHGDLLVLCAAFFWACHVLLIGHLSPRMVPVKLACFQFAVCSALSFLVAIIVETTTLEGLLGGAIPILYAGFISVGIAYTLQVVAQREARPAHVAIILSLETVFAAIGGWWMLNEVLGPRGLVGCALILGGMLLSRLTGKTQFIDS
jgi:drug/metabolite transporter (DMT)-like permease